MLMRRIFAYMVDSFIAAIATSIILFMSRIILEKVLNIDSFIASSSYYLIMFMVMLSDIIINFIICMLNKGHTVGDDLLHINITSHKFYDEKFYIIRLLLRTLSIYFSFIFIFINIFIMFREKKYNIVWYDKLLGINCISD